MSVLFIEDGYVLDAVVPALGRWAALAYRYRPALPEKVYAYMAAKKDGGKAWLKANVDLLTAHLVGWDATGPDGAPLAVSAELLAKVPVHVLRHMIDAVTGFDAQVDEGN